MYTAGVDVGGTFTDFVVVEDETGFIHTTKVPSTPAAPDKGVIHGIEKLAREFGIEPTEIGFLLHGTTVATNALIERKGVETALITTQGFRDVLHIGRQTRPKLYDFFERRADPLIPRQHRLEVSERIRFDGTVAHPLKDASVHEAVKRIDELGIHVVAVCLLHSYANPDHERRVREIFLAEAPGVHVAISSDVLPEFKEFERMSTTVINAYVMPIVEQYLKRIVRELSKRKIRAELNIMQSNGGVMTAATAGHKSVHTVLSGPAAGVLGAIEQARLIGAENIITIDMGGTSFDVSLASGGTPSLTSEGEINGHPVKVPMIDIKTLGAGGGSIASIDAGGALQVGPESAGAEPGPVCYGRGGTDPTVSDANLVLGYLNPEIIAGGEIRLDSSKARRVIAEKIASPLGLSVEAAAEGIIRVVNETMNRGIRLVSVERGYDPRDFSLVSFGGAGPVHAVRLAQELGIPRVVVPESPGVNCAMGLLMADFRHDYARTYLRPVRDLAPADIRSAYLEMEERAFRLMLAEGVGEKRVVLQYSADMRYAGQGHELEVNLERRPENRANIESMALRLGELHRHSFGYAMDAGDAEIVNLRLQATGRRPKPRLAKEDPGNESPEPAFAGIRRAYMEGGFLDAAVYRRPSLRCGMRISAPAIIEQADSTTVLFPGYRIHVDPYRNLIATREID